MVSCFCQDNGGESFYSDDICGNFTIPCDQEPETIWQSDLIVTGTISVYYSKGCAEGSSLIFY
ncbi:S-Ena type endospore appendage [Gracilibacillus boraciitolerans]|uniref:S-Ena type endospore appendage n=1 Tax=Gracilibacillus boraciitolerans TaxID=307521 RepID=UPI00055319E3|nr:S-Ena type endospore appendage [Gracilibacillus boraciitolerans]